MNPPLPPPPLRPTNCRCHCASCHAQQTLQYYAINYNSLPPQYCSVPTGLCSLLPQQQQPPPQQQQPPVRIMAIVPRTVPNQQAPPEPSNNQCTPSSFAVPSSSSILRRSVIANPSNLVRDVLPTKNGEMTGNAQNSLLKSNLSGPAAQLRDGSPEKLLSGAYARIRAMVEGKDKEIKALKEANQSLSDNNAKLRKDVPVAKREKTMAVKEMTKMQKQLEAEEIRAQEHLEMIEKQREELTVQKTTIGFLEKTIHELEGKLTAQETKNSDLCTNHLGEKVEYLVANNQRKALAKQVGDLTRSLNFYKAKVSALTAQSTLLQQENDALTTQVKLHQVELKAERMIKDQILSEHASWMVKPATINQLLIQRTDSSKLLSLLLANTWNAEAGSAGAASNVNEGAVVPGIDANNAAAIRQGYDELMEEVNNLKKTISVEEESRKRKREESMAVVAFVDTAKKRRVSPTGDASPKQSASVMESGEEGENELYGVYTEDFTVQVDLDAVDLQEQEQVEMGAEDNGQVQRVHSSNTTTVNLDIPVILPS